MRRSEFFSSVVVRHSQASNIKSADDSPMSGQLSPSLST